MKAIEVIYTEEELDEIRDQGRRHDDLCWWFGDKGNETYKKLQGLKSDIMNGRVKLSSKQELKILGTTQQDIYNQVGEEAGKSGRTIRYYAELAAFYIGDIRELYEVLPLNHYEFAKQYPAFAEDILEFSLRAMDGNNGKPRSAAWLGVNCAGILGDQGRLKHLQDMQEIENSIEYGDLEAVAADNQDEAVSPITYHLVRQVPKVAVYLRTGIEKWETVSDEDKTYLYDLIYKIEEKICQLAGVEV